MSMKPLNVSDSKEAVNTAGLISKGLKNLWEVHMGKHWVKWQAVRPASHRNTGSSPRCSVFLSSSLLMPLGRQKMAPALGHCHHTWHTWMESSTQYCCHLWSEPAYGRYFYISNSVFQTNKQTNKKHEEIHQNFYLKNKEEKTQLVIFWGC